MEQTIFEAGRDYPAQQFDAESVQRDDMERAAWEAFGVRYLFAWQKLVIANILDSAAAARAGERAADDAEGDLVCRGRQIVLLPTGAGKSLCFLIPALLLHGPTLVVYPLLALMADQLRRMQDGNIGAVMFRGGQSEAEREENFARIRSGAARVIIANPEVLQNEALVRRLAACRIAHVAVDEAHCVSEWGDQFRPAYLTLGDIIKRLGAPVVTAFTATASPPVLQRVREILFDGSAHLVQGGCDRPNIHYAVRFAYAKQKAVLRAVAESERPLIVFCGTRARTEITARLLAEYVGNEHVRFYHAGMTKEEKAAVESWFFASGDGILTATCAYGMGMDKGNIRTVVHLDAPAHLENFVQEAGRAGRDGANAKSVLVWSHADDLRCRQAPPGSREKLMGGFARSRSCRRQFMLDQFAAETVVCSGCDICDAARTGKPISAAADDAERVLRFIRRNRRLYTRDELVGRLVDVLNGHDRTLFGINVWEASDVEEVLAQLVCEGRVRICGRLWRGRVDIGVKPLRAVIPRRLRRRLHSLRRLARLPVRVRARRLGVWVRAAFCGSAPRTRRH